MKKDKLKDIKGNSILSLEEKKKELVKDKIKELAKLSSAGKKNSKKIKEIKKGIARIETVISQKLIEDIENENSKS